MADEERLVLLLEARVAEFEKRMRKADQTATNSYRRMQGSSRSATRQMEADMLSSTNRINQALASVSGKIGSFGKAFIGGAIGGVAAAAFAGLTSNITDAVKSIAQIGDEAKRAGMGLQAFQEWTAVAERTRIGMDALVDGFKELNLRADEFIVTGGGSASEAFERLGYSAADLKTKLKDPSALMLDIIERLQDFDTGARIRIADELFGGTGGEQFVQLLDRGADGIRAIISETHAAGAVLDAELIRKAQDIDERFTAMTQKFSAWGKALVVALADLPFDVVETRLREVFPDEAFGRAVLGDEIFDRLAELHTLTDEQVDATERLKGAQTGLGEEARKAASALLMSINELPSQEFADMRTKLAEIAEEMRTAAAQFESGSLTANEFQEKLSTATTKAEGLFSVLKNDQDITLSSAISAIGRLATSIAGAITLARSLKASLPGGVAKEVPGYLDNAEGPGTVWEEVSFPQGDRRNRPGPRAPNDMWWLDPVGTGSKSKGGKDQFERALEQIKAQTGAMEAEAAALIAAAKGGKDYGDALEYARKRAELLHAAQMAGKKLTPELRAEIDALAQAYVTAGLDAEKAADKLERIKEAGERGADAISDIFTSVLDGSKSAKQAVADLLMEMAKVQMRKGILGLAESSGGKGFFGMIGSLLGYSSGGYTGSGGTYEPKGVVHGGEYVFSKAAVQRIGLPMLEAMHRGVPGYANGGVVAPRQASPGLPVNNAKSAGIQEVRVTVGVDPNTGNLTAFVDQRAQSVSQHELKRATPGILGKSVKASAEASRKSKSVFGLR